MERLLVILARAAIVLLQALPLSWVARIGRAAGGLVWLFDARHRRVAAANLALAFPDTLSAGQIHALVRENFRRIGENLACALRTAVMSRAEIARVLEVVGVDRVRAEDPSLGPSRVMAIGHFGNFELYAHAQSGLDDFQFATTYRAVRQPALNELLQQIRERSGCLFFERRTGAEALRRAMNEHRLMIGFLADQHTRRGLRLPFFGHDCLTSTAPAVFALRYKAPLHVAVCYRLAPGRWRIEVSHPIPLFHEGQPRDIACITREINQHYEAAIRRDPANWFWVHQRWKENPRAVPASPWNKHPLIPT